LCAQPPERYIGDARVSPDPGSSDQTIVYKFRGNS